MNNKLVKRIRRELTANPKKALALGGLVLVALYFWAPLIGSWLSPAATPSVPASSASVPPVVPPSVANSPGISPPTGGKSASAPPSWQQLVQWRTDDLRTQPAAPLRLERDPFQRSKSRTEKIAEVAREKEKAAAAVHRWTPQELGLQLTSTIVGGQRSVALISGKAYSQGQTLELSKDGQTLVLTVAEIHANRIVVTVAGQRIELIIPERQGSGRIEVVKSP